MRGVLKRILSPFIKKATDLYHSKPRSYSYNGSTVKVVPGVFPPFFTMSTKRLLRFLDTQNVEGKSFLELGCGCGIISIYAAKKGAFVTASDINVMALDQLTIDAKKNGVALDIVYSDLFENLHGRTFEYIFINPPYYPRIPTSITEKAWFCGEDFEYFKKLFPYFAGLTETKIFMILSEDCAIDIIRQVANHSALKLTVVFSTIVAMEKNFIFQIK